MYLKNKMGKAKAVRKESSAPPDSDSQSDYLLSKIQNHSRANLGWGGDCDVYPSFFLRLWKFIYSRYRNLHSQSVQNISQFLITHTDLEYKNDIFANKMQ